MNFDALRENLIYVLKESQIKIGYTDNTSSINYPPLSLRHLLDEDIPDEELPAVLAAFCDYARGQLGDITVSQYDGQYCLTVSRKGVRYVHEHVQDSGFLTELVALIREHRSTTIEDVLSVFRKYSDNVICEEADDDEYNYVIYFGDGKPDDFVYLVETDLGHASYHRMIRPDYEAMIG